MRRGAVTKTVNIGKLGKKLRREATANPKKAALLGLVALVAVYFWAPLLKGWIGTSSSNMATTTAPSGSPSASAAESAGAAPSLSQPAVPDRPSWQHIVQWMRQDPRTRTAAALTTKRNPFESPVIEMAEATEGMPKEPPRPKAPKITPQSVGLVLNSTIIGPQRRIAQISGKTYMVGQTVEVVKEKESFRTRFKLLEVDAHRVVLEADAERYELAIPEPGKSDRIELSGGVRSK
jgi:hypothetical protein